MVAPLEAIVVEPQRLTLPPYRVAHQWQAAASEGGNSI